MPHIIIEYSANVEMRFRRNGWSRRCTRRRSRAASPMLPAFARGPSDAIVYRVGDGNPSNGFVHIVARIRHGRSVEQRKALAASLMAAADKALEQAFAARPLALSVEVHEIDPETRLMRNTMREPAPGEKAA